ncbi:MAG TPA: outer membrane lipoprotein LolB [Chromatiaceae bacterium]|jgi:outer membrane lipoprotein LolB|nr:outer membrane lipoprotein LolB [Chromatiaceae bacterium]HIB84242.1 outer membrane lipoprotein LolB [Chromatiaceae bacterium]HIN82013.1 outer membrane lipoprotein LolB [Chromatiales bacterium]HIO13658.1 outer membrane lipoprotein LolB [Chromatiales bacterium]
MVVALTACSGLPPVPANAQLLVVPDSTPWLLRGRMALQQGDSGWSAHIIWLNEGELSGMCVLGPLGSAVAELRVRPGLVLLRQAGQPPLIMQSAKELMQRYFSLDIDLPELRNLILAQHLDNPEIALQRSSTGMPEAVLWQDWRVQYLRFQEVEGGYLPARVVIHGPEVRLKLVLESWAQVESGRTLPSGCQGL